MANEWIDSYSEYAPAFVFILVAAAIVVVSFDYSARARLFPILIGVFVILTSAIALLDRFLPSSFHQERTDQLVELDEMEELEGDEASEEGSREDLIIFSASIAGYVILSYLVGFTISSGAFMFGYTVWRQMPWHVVLLMTALGILIPQAFLFALGGPFNDGALVSIGDLV